MDVEYEVVSNILQGKNILTEEHYDHKTLGGNIDFFVTDSSNYTDYNDSKPFEAFNLVERVNSGEVISLELPTDNRWYAVLSNEFSQRTTKIVNITVDLYGTLHVGINAPKHNSDQALDSVVTIKGNAFSVSHNHTQILPASQMHNIKSR